MFNAANAIEDNRRSYLFSLSRSILSFVSLYESGICHLCVKSFVIEGISLQYLIYGIFCLI